MADLQLQPISWQRMSDAVDNVRRRLERATAALERAGIRYAVAGGNAVAAWVSRVDVAAVRNTQDVDLLVQRQDLGRVRQALEAAGFVYRHTSGLDVFLDGPDATARDAVHLVFAGEKVRDDHPSPAPSLDEAEDDPAFRIVSLDALVRMKLNAFRRKDQVHLLDLIEMGLVDVDDVQRLPAPLAARLQELLDHPDA